MRRHHAPSSAVVITGAHRSGTTVLGDLVATSPGTWTVWEPLNQHWGVADAPAPYLFLRDEATSSPAIDSLQRYLDSGWTRWSVKRGEGGSRMPALNERVRQVRRHVQWHHNRGRTAVVKDPFALLALPGLIGSVSSRPAVVSVRHPCSWVQSLRRVGWPAGPELNAMVAQEELYETHLRDILPRRDWTAADELEAGALAWTCLYRTVLRQASPRLRMLVVPMEAFGRDPTRTMQTVYHVLGLQPPDGLDEITSRYTRAGNPVSPTSGQVHLLQRDSRALGQAWRDQLTRTEADTVRRITEPVFTELYSDWDTGDGDPVDLTGSPTDPANA